jgi:hypothetical protein
MTGDAMRPHPHGLEGRVADALDDAELIAADPTPTRNGGGRPTPTRWWPRCAPTRR